MKEVLSLLIFCISILIGCSTTPKEVPQRKEPAEKVWTHPNKTQEEFQQDVIECRYDASKHSQPEATSRRDLPMQIISTRIRMNMLFNECMQVRGYYLKEK
jgi:hypothetical protein